MNDFENLYRLHARDVYRFALYLCGNRADAEDITSDTFVRAWNAGGTIRAATAKAYLFTISRNIYLQGLRRAVRQIPIEESLPDPGDDPQESAEARAELGRVLKALQQMPELDRTVLLLRVLEALPYEEIALVAGLSLAAVKVKVHRARLKLARLRANQSDQEVSK